MQLFLPPAYQPEAPALHVRPVATRPPPPRALVVPPHRPLLVERRAHRAPPPPPPPPPPRVVVLLSLVHLQALPPALVRKRFKDEKPLKNKKNKPLQITDYEYRLQ